MKLTIISLFTLLLPAHALPHSTNHPEHNPVTLHPRHESNIFPNVKPTLPLRARQNNTSEAFTAEQRQIIEEIVAKKLDEEREKETEDAGQMVADSLTSAMTENDENGTVRGDVDEKEKLEKEDDSSSVGAGEQSETGENPARRKSASVTGEAASAGEVTEAAANEG